jgi:hypothetical protein
MTLFCPQRWPEFFAKTIFLTDRFHQVCHKCSSEYKFCAHALSGREDVDTSALEQINAVMKPLDNTLRTSGLESGMLLTDTWALEWNAKIVRGLLNLRHH